MDLHIQLLGGNYLLQIFNRSNIAVALYCRWYAEHKIDNGTRLPEAGELSPPLIKSKNYTKPLRSTLQRITYIGLTADKLISALLITSYYGGLVSTADIRVLLPTQQNRSTTTNNGVVERERVSTVVSSDRDERMTNGPDIIDSVWILWRRRRTMTIIPRTGAC
jgi:hypothetical protein